MDLLERLRKQATCVYIVVDEGVADDLADGLKQAIAEIERLRAALNDVATMSFSPKPAGMSELEWTVCNLRTLQLYAGEALIANEQQTVVPSADDAVVLHPPSSVMWSDLYLATDNARLPPEGSASDASEQQAPAKQVGMDWELSDEAKQQLAEIDKHIKR